MTDAVAKDCNYAQVFDSTQEVNFSEHTRPHWTQAGTTTFITMRLADSLPREVLKRWDREKLGFLHQHDIRCDHWRDGVEQLDSRDLTLFQKQFRRAREMELDLCHDDCHLSDPAAAEIVASSLLYFDGDRYLVVMPNHLHMLVAFPDSVSLKKQCYSWMRYTATRINRLAGRSGSLWQEEPFDHLVRSERQLDYLRAYIAENPVKASLSPGSYLYRKSNRKL